MESGWNFFSIWKENEYIISTALTVVTVLLAVQIYRYQRNDHEKEILECVASEFDTLFIHNFMELYKEFSQAFKAPQGHRISVGHCMKKIDEFPLDVNFSYWDVHRENVRYLWGRKYCELDKRKRMESIDVFIRNARKVASNISSLERDLKKAKDAGIEFFDQVTITPGNDKYLDVAKEAFAEMESSIRNLPSEILLHKFQEDVAS